VISRRAALVGGLAAPFVSSARADIWPTKQVRFICPFVPGGGTDAVSRIVAQELTEIFGQQVIVDNRPGAGGNIGTTELARATDGHTIGLISVASHAINPALHSKLPYDPDKDIIAVSLVAMLVNLLGVWPGLPVKTVPELIALAKKEPGKYAFSSSGLGSSLHLSGELFKSMAGVDILHVPYKGAGAAFQDLLAGRVHMQFGNIPSMLQQVRAGKLRGLAVTGPQRSKAIPELPTVAETLPGYVATSWYGVGAPASTPEPVIVRLEDAIKRMMAKPDIQTRWDEMGLDMPPLGRPGLPEFIAKERALWVPVVKASGAKVE
jgi:tripartite-type tricarboxylate transporter receptor subunit TctC